MSVIYTLAVCAIIFLIAIEFVLSRILSRLDKIHTTMNFIHQDMFRIWERLDPRQKQTKKKRTYYLDENGQRRWRKTDG